MFPPLAAFSFRIHPPVLTDSCLGSVSLISANGTAWRCGGIWKS